MQNVINRAQQQYRQQSTGVVAMMAVIVGLQGLLVFNVERLCGLRDSGLYAARAQIRLR